ncbi:MAG: DUF2339 domain-containing protein, partial [Candidatus Omnitrophica bacterium]|nr:DUF2339 domain-containing protein [Candidatus Omnitrophota bacterium]
MRICPKCKKAYDDTWKVCLNCNVQLVDSDNAASEIERIKLRLDKIERSLGIAAEVPPVSTKPVEVFQEREPLKEAKKEDIESRIGLVWLNRIGLFALFLGVAFFLKYAFDNRWIGELGRVVLGLMAGSGMIVASEFTRRKNYDVISQGFHGGGVAILYLSIFSAFGFYHLIGAIPALAFMSIVTLYCGFWSTRTGWISSAVIAILGGFLTPFLIGPDKIGPGLLFSYVILLDVGVLFISIFKKWEVLNIASF